MTTESNQPSGDERSSEPLRLSIGEQTYEVPTARVGHLVAALIVADQTCTATGRSVHNKPPEGVTGNVASAPHYLAADVAGDIAHWITQQTGVTADPAAAPRAEEVPC